MVPNSGSSGGESDAGRSGDESESGDNHGKKNGRESENGGPSGESDGGDGQSGGGQSGEQQGTSTAEKAVMAISVAFTVLLFAYAGWQMVDTPTSETPQVSVQETEPLANGSVAVTVRLRNPGDVGLVSATVQSNCSSPPPEIGFSYVPAASARTGTLVCPDGTTEPPVSMENWIHR